MSWFCSVLYFIRVHVPLNPGSENGSLISCSLLWIKCPGGLFLSRKKSERLLVSLLLAQRLTLDGMYQRRTSSRSQNLTLDNALLARWSGKFDSGVQVGKILQNLPTFMSILAHYSLFLHLNKSIPGSHKEVIPRERPADTFSRIRGLFGLVSILWELNLIQTPKD